MNGLSAGIKRRRFHYYLSFANTFILLYQGKLEGFFFISIIFVSDISIYPFRSYHNTTTLSCLFMAYSPFSPIIDLAMSVCFLAFISLCWHFLTSFGFSNQPSPVYVFGYLLICLFDSFVFLSLFHSLLYSPVSQSSQSTVFHFLFLSNLFLLTTSSIF